MPGGLGRLDVNLQALETRLDRAADVPPVRRSVRRSRRSCTHSPAYSISSMSRARRSPGFESCWGGRGRRRRAKCRRRRGSTSQSVRARCDAGGIAHGFRTRSQRSGRISRSTADPDPACHVAAGRSLSHVLAGQGVRASGARHKDKSHRGAGEDADFQRTVPAVGRNMKQPLDPVYSSPSPYSGSPSRSITAGIKANTAGSPLFLKWWYLRPFAQMGVEGLGEEAG
jgi:hypothetical protein